MSLYVRPDKLNVTPGIKTFVGAVAAGGTTILAQDADNEFNTIQAVVNLLDATNLSATAGIVGPQLSPTAGIVRGQITPPAFQRVSITAGLDTGTSGPETTFATLPSITTTGGKVRLSSSGVLVADVGVALSSIHIRWYRDATMVSDVKVAVNSPPGTTLMPLPVPSYIDTPSSGSYVYALKIIGGTQGVRSDGTLPGEIYAEETLL